ncbi:hypothetical protein ACJX0J_009761, partial [Zea mays]
KHRYSATIFSALVLVNYPFTQSPVILLPMPPRTSFPYNILLLRSFECLFFLYTFGLVYMQLKKAQCLANYLKLIYVAFKSWSKVQYISHVCLYEDMMTVMLLLTTGGVFLNISGTKFQYQQYHYSGATHIGVHGINLSLAKNIHLKLWVTSNEREKNITITYYLMKENSGDYGLFADAIMGKAEEREENDILAQIGSQEATS